jgi:hypothetical protein
MTTVPGIRPFMEPVAAFIVAIAVLPLVHVPAGMALASVDGTPWQAENDPVIGKELFTVTGRNATHAAEVT